MDLKIKLLFSFFDIVSELINSMFRFWKLAVSFTIFGEVLR